MMAMLKLVLVMLLLERGTSLASANGSTTTEEVERAMDENRLVVAEPKDYSKWLNQMGSSNKQALFEKSNDDDDNNNKKLRPCLTLKVRHRRRSKSSRMFTTLQKAIDAIPVVNNCRVVVSIGKGTFREKVEIPATMGYVTLKGAGAGKTIIEWDDTADRIGKDGHPLGTYGSATFAVNAPYFIARNITFKNKAPPPPAGALGKQAVALRISADRAAFIGCKFIGAQDTLYDHFGRHYFKHCYIEGSVDFVFGNGLSLYQKCHLHAVTNSFGALTAQKRGSLLEETGFSFVGCRVTGSGALYLGRAWGSFSRVVFAYTFMDKIITPPGWYDWGDKNREMTVFFGQYKCSGPGANHGGRVSWSRELTDTEAEPFISLGFIDGHDWLPESL